MVFPVVMYGCESWTVKKAKHQRIDAFELLLWCPFGIFFLTEELYKKDLHDPDNHDDVITNLEPDILECEGKWALGSITMN